MKRNYCKDFKFYLIILSIAFAIIMIFAFVTIEDSAFVYADAESKEETDGNMELPTTEICQLSENECIKFILDHNVKIPDEYAGNVSLGKYVKEIIHTVENDPFYTFSFSYDVISDFANNIKTAVNAYHGIESVEDTQLLSTTDYTLVDSTLWSIPDFIEYNCYAYAIGRDENPASYPTSRQYQPGDISNTDFNMSMTVEEIVNVVEQDLTVLGCRNITVTDSIPDNITSDAKLICVRRGDLDYHFMKFDYDYGAWFHKPGMTAILKYKYQPSVDRIWTGEYVNANGTAQSSIFTYTSKIYYIKYYEDLSHVFDGGNGTPSNPFLVSNEEQFRYIGSACTTVYVPRQGYEDQITYSFKLTNDIVLHGDWEPFANDLTGNFDGDNHYVTYEMTITQGDLLGKKHLHFGLFSFITNYNQVKNLELRNCVIKSGGDGTLPLPQDDISSNNEINIGILAGSVYEASELNNVRVVDSVIDCNIEHAWVGGIGGSIQMTYVTNCSVTGGSITNYNGGATGGMAGIGDLVRFSGGRVATTITKNNYSDSDMVGPVVGNEEGASTVDISQADVRKNGNCIAAGTLITLADGSQVPVESLTGDEMLLVWNLTTGQFDSAPILFIDSDPVGKYQVIDLSFSDGTNVKVIYEHGFWDYDLNKYVYLGTDAAQYIGHWFNKQTTDENGEWQSVRVQLTGVEVGYEEIAAYSPVTYKHFCYYVNGMLSMPGGIGGLFNTFEVDPETMRYDEASMQADIQTYGLFTYEEFAELVPVSEAVFEAFNGQYLKIAIGKGFIDIPALRNLALRYAAQLEII